MSSDREAVKVPGWYAHDATGDRFLCGAARPSGAALYGRYRLGAVTRVTRDELAREYSEVKPTDDEREWGLALMESWDFDRRPKGPWRSPKDGKVVHRAKHVRADGACSALCFKAPRPIDLTKATWTTRDDGATCPKCLALMAAQGAGASS